MIISCCLPPFSFNRLLESHCVTVFHSFSLPPALIYRYAVVFLICTVTVACFFFWVYLGISPVLFSKLGAMRPYTPGCRELGGRAARSCGASRGGTQQSPFGPNFWQCRALSEAPHRVAPSRLLPGSWHSAVTLVASQFYGVKGGGGARPEGVVGSLSPLRKGAAEPRTAASPVLGLVVAPLERRRGRRWRPRNPDGHPYLYPNCSG